MAPRWFVPFLAISAVAAGGCLPPEPDVPPAAEASDEASPEEGGWMRVSAMREIVWASRERTIRITWGSHLCQKGGGRGESCVKLSAADRRQLLEVFGPDEFRSRLAAYRACPAQIGSARRSAMFAVTYADGQQIGKVLDAPMGSPETRYCDREVRSAVVDTEEDLVRRYLR